MTPGGSAAATMLCLALASCVGGPVARSSAGPDGRSAGALGTGDGSRGNGRTASLAAELGCGACHRGVPGPELVRERAPALGRDGRRPTASFLFRYLRNPVAQRSDIGRSRMPDFRLDSAEAAAVTLFLLDRQGTPLREADGPEALRRARARSGVDAARGERIFRALNCAGCHPGTGVDPWKNGPSLADVGDRTREDWLRRWLRDPEAIRPYGLRPGTGSRMPDFRLDAAEADSLTAALVGNRPDADGAPGAGARRGEDGLEPPSPYEAAKAEALLSRRLPCLGCHRLGSEGGRIGPALDDVGSRRPSEFVLGTIRNPASHAPGTAMPPVPMPEGHAELIASYLLGRAGSGAGRGSPTGERTPPEQDGPASAPAGGAGPDVPDRDRIRGGYLSLVDHPIRAPEVHETRPVRAPAGAEILDRGAPGGEALYGSSCASCHGVRGDGDGYNARYLPVRPTSHASASLMSRRSDATLFDGIHAGGRVLDRNHFMPPFGAQLSRKHIWSLVRYIRSLCDCRGPDAAPGRTGVQDAGDRETGGWQASPGRDPDATPLAYGPPAASVSADDFVGAEACRQCHADAYRAWAGSTHGTAGGEPGPDVVITPFDGDTIRFRDATVVAVRSAASEYAFEGTWEGYGSFRYTVDGVVGKGHMVGGGNQGYLTRWADGTLRFLPFDYSRTEDRWFCNTIGRRDRGWQPTEDVALADCSDWPPSRALGNPRRLNNCQECHGSQIRVRVRRGAPHFETDLQSLQVNCESCHGPGQEHVRLARDGTIPGQEEIGIDGLAAAGKDASLQVCFQCHALKTSLERGYLPGQGFRERYALMLPMLGDRPYFPDGRVRTFAYQGTHLSSQCYLSGSMTCTDCHQPHAQDYRDHTGRALEGRLSDGQCTSCHPSKSGPDASRHTHHPPDSEGSRCVACHMPYLQEPVLGRKIRYARSDHTIPVPRPAFDATLDYDGQPLGSACRTCHGERTSKELQARAEEWWGEPEPHDPLVAGLLAADTVADLERAAELLVRPNQRDPMAQYQALVRLVTQRLSPDMEALPGETRPRLERLAREADLEVRSLALATLHYARGQDPDLQRTLTALVDPLDAEETAVSRRWAVILGFLADRHRDAGELRDALVTYRKALEIEPERADLHMALGRAYAAGGSGEAALDAYRRSLELKPDRALPWVNMGIVHASRGRSDAAAAAFRTALEINPDEPLAHFNLANLSLRLGRPAEAAERYRTALDRDPGLAPAHFNLARALVELRRHREALASVRQGLEYAPDRSRMRELARRLEEALGGG